MLRRLECQVRALEAGATPKRKQSQKMAEKTEKEEGKKQKKKRVHQEVWSRWEAVT